MKKLILGLVLSFSILTAKAAVEYDVVKSIDLTSTNYITASLLNQLVDTAKIGTTNKGIVIRRSGGGGTYWPDVTSNPRYTNFLWLDTITSPATLKQYVCCGDVYSNWVSTVVTPGSVSTTEILDFTITDSDLATNSVSDFALKASSVSGNKIADNGILAGKLSLASVILGNYAFGSIVGGNITNNTITDTNLADSAVTRLKLAPNAVYANHLSNNIIQNQHLSNSVVYNTNIAAATIESNRIASATINPSLVITNMAYGIASAWAVVDSNGTLLKGLNISAASRRDTGDYQLTFGSGFAPSGTNYVVFVTPLRSSGTGVAAYSNTTTTVNYNINGVDGNDTDSSVSIIIYNFN